MLFFGISLPGRGFLSDLPVRCGYDNLLVFVATSHNHGLSNATKYSAAFTLDRYGHVTATMRQASANRMQAFIDAM